ncbi:MAG: hypothetical protein CUN56_02675, partial [Phototrophicales bacterium]
MGKKWLIIILAMAFVFVMPVAAQSSPDINVQDILDALAPRKDQALLFDILLYLIFFLGLINTM